MLDVFPGGTSEAHFMQITALTSPPPHTGMPLNASWFTPDVPYQFLKFSFNKHTALNHVPGTILRTLQSIIHSIFSQL